MTVRRLLSEADSLELSQWRVFLDLDATLQDERARRAREDARVMGE